MIDSKQASEALTEIDEIVHRVRQSRIYDIASQIMIVWGVLVLCGNLANWTWPRSGSHIWIAVDLLGVAGMAGLGTLSYRRTGVRAFDLRVLAAIVLFFAFGIFSVGLGHFGVRELAVFWPTYVMLFYCLAGLWFGHAFVVIGLVVSGLTLIGYFLITGAAFLPWMALTNGGGLILGGLWMRRS